MLGAASLAWMGLSAVVFVALQFRTAPYGRHEARGWGPSVPSRPAWMVMESPAVVWPLTAFATGDRSLVPALLGALWLLHYVDRAVLWPLRMRLDGKTMPLAIAAMAFASNCVIDGLVAWSVFHGAPRDVSWLADPRFVLGVALFFVGYGVNRWADGVLAGLRAPGETGYRVPQGGLYELVSCPNYLGELIQWAGFALAAWTLPALAFVVWSASNLVPRAGQHHAWYRSTFEGYPQGRKALVPFLW